MEHGGSAGAAAGAAVGATPGTRPVVPASSDGSCAPAAPAPDEAPVATLMDADRAACLAGLFKALADPTRVRLLGHIAAAPDGTACACHLPEALGIGQPTLSHHLKKLVGAGLLAREQRGRWAHYTVEAGAVDAVRAFLGDSLAPGRCC